jgi:hypothetical protein
VTHTLRAAAVALASGAALFSARALAADSFRCGNSLIMTGMTAGEVLAKCGKPLSREVERVPIRARTPYGATHVTGWTSVEYWVYDRAPGQFLVRLTFAEDQLEDIEMLHERSGGARGD